jgi:hypothetical protein
MYKEHERKNYENGNKFLLDGLTLIGISGRDRVPYYRGIVQLESD